MENGRWIRIKGTHTDNCVTYQCSVCGKTALWVRGMKSLYPSDNCPHCGAGMVAKRTAVANQKDLIEMKREKKENNVVAVACDKCGFKRNIRISDCMKATVSEDYDSKPFAVTYEYFCPVCHKRIFNKEEVIA